MMAKSEIKLQLDAASVDAVVVEINLFLAEFAERLPRLSQAFIDRLHTFIEVGCIDFDKSVGSGEKDTIALRPKLADDFIEFMAAARAGDFDVDGGGECLSM